MSNRDLLIEAVRNLSVVTGTFRGHNRVFSPHAVGYYKGVSRTHVWQSGGTSRAGLPAGGMWRYFDTDELQGLQLSNGKFDYGQPTHEDQVGLDEITIAIDGYQ